MVTISITSFELSPDGSKVFYLADTEVFGRYDLFRSNIDGSGKTKLVSPCCAGHNGSIAPILDGSSGASFNVKEDFDY
mgnify:CR=1 FL=1